MSLFAFRGSHSLNSEILPSAAGACAGANCAEAIAGAAAMHAVKNKKEARVRIADTRGCGLYLQPA